jgi:hypothetical protein
MMRLTVAIMGLVRMDNAAASPSGVERIVLRSTWSQHQEVLDTTHLMPQRRGPTTYQRGAEAFCKETTCSTTFLPAS